MTSNSLKYQIIATIEDGNFQLQKSKQVETKQVVWSILKKLKKHTKEDNQFEEVVEFRSISELISADIENKVVGVVANISKFDSPAVVDFSDDLVNEMGLKKTKIRTSAIALSDGVHEVRCMNLCGEKDIEFTRSLLDKRVRVIGVPVLIPTQHRRSSTFFHILDIQEHSSCLEMLSPSKSEVLWVRNWYEKSSKKDFSLLDFFEEKVCKHLNIQFGKGETIKKIIRFAILMVLSGGRSDRLVLSLNLFLIGRSGAGKKIVRDVIEFLSPIFIEAQASKVNRVGLMGPTSFKNGKWTVTPGLLPRAHGGCLAIQDAHGIEDMKGVASQFSMVMEDGRLKASNASMFEVEVVASLLLDMNRKHHITGAQSDSEVDDLWGLPTHIYTRFDGIVDLPPDVERQLSVAVAMIRNFKKPNVDLLRQNQRRSKLIVGYVKDELLEVDISEVREYAADKLADYFRQNHEVFKEYPNLGDFQLRMSNSFIKIIVAVTKSHLRKTSRIVDVDEASEFLKLKIDYLVKSAPNLSSRSLVENIKDKPSLRQKALKNKFSRTDVPFDTIFLFYQSEFGFKNTGLKEKIYRDLKKCAKRIGGGKWQF